MLVILLVPFIAALLVAGLVSAVTGMSFDNAVSLLLVIGVVLAVWVGGRRLIHGLLRWWSTVVRDGDLRAPVDFTEQVLGTAGVAKQAMDSAQELAVEQQKVFRRALEEVGAELDDAQSRHGTAGTGTGTGEFTGSKDIPFLLAAFARENVKNLGTILLTTQQTAGRRMAEAVDHGVVLPEDLGYPGHRRSLRARGDDGYG